MLLDLPLPRDTFCGSHMRKGDLLPPSLAAFSGYADRSLIHKNCPGGSSSFLPRQLACSQAPHPAAAAERDAQLSA